MPPDPLAVPTTVENLGALALALGVPLLLLGGALLGWLLARSP